MTNLMAPKENKLRTVKRLNRNLKPKLPKTRTQGKFSPKKIILRQQRVACSLRKISKKKLSLLRSRWRSKTLNPKQSRRSIKFKRKKSLLKSLTNLQMVRHLLT
jgi:hypothetical protein